ncbi:cilia- and flagella-associated protein 251-like [Vigna umbellata]|uniref:cilia- and flagella-associated protein 251-like n=1 Tax=Vigna umbellata TaxID=87088 RepID=UPI001F5E893C|nr:cilia- and flagella-associated protein 251-like [Vigna umbellata]
MEEEVIVEEQHGYVVEDGDTVEVEDVLMDDEEEEGNVEEENVERGEEQPYVHEEEEEEEEEEEQEQEGNVVEGEVLENVDDSKEERMANDDDGFGMENERVEEEIRNINPILDRGSRMKKRKKTVRRRIQDSEGSFMINEEVGEHGINEDYNTDELSSNVDNDEPVSENKRQFPKYRADDMTKSFKFKLEMEFKSLKDFKSAL